MHYKQAQVIFSCFLKKFFFSILFFKKKQNSLSIARLTGHSENKDEVKKFGVYSEA